MAVPRNLHGTRVQNPGDDTYQIWTGDPVITRFSTITIDEPDPTVPLSGVLTFSLGNDLGAIDLGAGDRFLALAGPVPMLYLEASGTVEGENWAYILS